MHGREKPSEKDVIRLPHQEPLFHIPPTHTTPQEEEQIRKHIRVELQTHIHSIAGDQYASLSGGATHTHSEQESNTEAYPGEEEEEDG